MNTLDSVIESVAGLLDACPNLHIIQSDKGLACVDGITFSRKQILNSPRELTRDCRRDDQNSFAGHTFDGHMCDYVRLEGFTPGCCANEMDPAFFPHKPHTSTMGVVACATHTHHQEERRGFQAHHDIGDRCGEVCVSVARGGCARARGAQPMCQARSWYREWRVCRPV